MKVSFLFLVLAYVLCKCCIKKCVTSLVAYCSDTFAYFLLFFNLTYSNILESLSVVRPYIIMLIAVASLRCCWCLTLGLLMYKMNAAPTMLFQKDFKDGTYIIDQPGNYALAEDISFNPNSPDYLGTDAYGAAFPLPHQYKSRGGQYDDFAFGVGFFCAIAVGAEGVDIDLNGFVIEQSKEHALLMRFFSVIETASAPFVPTEGPSNFGPQITSAKNILIHNGTIGRSSHHGIHGNLNVNVRVHDVIFIDFEVAAVSLNGVEGLSIVNCTASSRDDVPILGIFSAGQFIKPYMDYLVNSQFPDTLNIGGRPGRNATAIRERLRSSINFVHEQLIVHGNSFLAAGSNEYDLFHNVYGVVDGNSYGFLVNQRGFAVEGFPYRPSYNNTAKNIEMINVHVLKLRANVNEIEALHIYNRPVVDPVGAVFQSKNRGPRGSPLTVSSTNDQLAVYVGNVVADAQALVAKAAHAGVFPRHLDTSRLTISEDIVDWVESSNTLDPALVNGNSGMLCNGDAMFHVNKGVVGFRLDGARNIDMYDTSARNVENLGNYGSMSCGQYDYSHPEATLEGYGGAVVRGYSMAGSKNIEITESWTESLVSRSGSAIGFDIMTNSKNIEIKRSYSDGISAAVVNTPPCDGVTENKAEAYRVSSECINVHVNCIRSRYVVEGKTNCPTKKEGPLRRRGGSGSESD